MSLFKKMLGLVFLSGTALAQIPVTPPGGSGAGGCNSGTTTNLLVGDGAGGCSSAGLATANVVTTNTTQTISGTKTVGAFNFTNNLNIVGAFGLVRNTGLTTQMGTNTSGFGMTETMTAITNTSGNSFIHSIGNGANAFTPASGTANFTGLLIDPVINGTSTGTAYGQVIAPVTNVLTGGTVKLQGWGTATGSNLAGYSEKAYLGLDGTFNGPVNASILRSPNTFVGRSQTGALNQTLLSSAVGAMYRINIASNCDLAVASAAYNLNLTYADPSGTTHNVSSSDIDCTTLGDSSVFNVTNVANLKSGSAVVLTSSTTGAVSYDVAVTVEQLTTN
jgi:hypothetical protein